MYVPSTSKIISSYNVVFDESVSSTLEYAPQTFSEAMAIRPSVTLTPYATCLREQTGDIITFTQFEGGNLCIDWIIRCGIVAADCGSDDS